ncbi:MAG: hypothetical protein M3Q28_07555, partial [Pseudomonadota bacterium]|nr:hypothetical protein [Pseudomonadota bacterium]
QYGASVVDKLFQQLRLIPRIASNDISNVFGPLGVESALLQQVSPTQDSVQRGAQIVIETTEQSGQ